MDFLILHRKFHLRPTCTAIIGFPIVIALILENIRYCLEKSDWQKIPREILIIFLESLKNVFIISKMMFLARRANIMVNFALQTPKTSPNHDFFITNQAKPLIFHGFPCQNFPTVNPSSRHAYRGGRWRPACFLNLLIGWGTGSLPPAGGQLFFRFRK